MSKKSRLYFSSIGAPKPGPEFGLTVKKVSIKFDDSVLIADLLPDMNENGIVEFRFCIGSINEDNSITIVHDYTGVIFQLVATSKAWKAALEETLLTTHMKCTIEGFGFWE
jgi:hypothetical protein